jgi:hypothetical protein
MPLAKPTKFYWFFGLWALVVTVGVLVPGIPAGGPEPGDVIGYWALAIGSTIAACALWPRMLHVNRGSIWFRSMADAEPEQLATPGAPIVRPLIALCCSAGAVFLVGGLAVSPALQHVAGLRGRTIDFPPGARTIEDLRPADIYLLPLNQFPEGAAANLAAELRRQTGLLVAALPAYTVPDMQVDPQRKQVVIESLNEGLKKRIEGTPLPPPPRPHPPLVVALLSEDAYSRVTDWRFVLSNSIAQSAGIVCTYRLHYGLPFEDRAAQQLLTLRTKKLILRLIAFHCFDAPRTTDAHSLTGTTLRGIEDLDNRTDYIEIPRPKR